MKCPNCLNEVNDNAVFCGKCGQPINQISALGIENADVSKPKNKVWLKIVLIITAVIVVLSAALAVLQYTNVIDITRIFSTEQTESTSSNNDGVNSEGNENSGNINSGNTNDTFGGQDNNTDNSNPSSSNIIIVVTEDGDRILDKNHIKKVEPYIDESTAYYGVLLTLTEEGTELFAKATRENIGKNLMIFVNDVLVLDATVQEEITDGRVLINDFSNEAAMELYNTISNAIGN